MYRFCADIKLCQVDVLFTEDIATEAVGVKVDNLHVRTVGAGLLCCSG